VPLSGASLVQPPTSGSFDASAGTASLGSGSTAGSAVLLIARVASGNLQLDVPAGFEADIVPIGLGGAILHAFRRKDIPAGESSWGLSVTLGTLVTWFAYEWAGLDLTEPLDKWATNGAAGVTSISTGTTPAASADDLLCMAVHAASIVTTFSGQTNGFVEGEERSDTSGSHGNQTIAVSRLYPGAAGTFECTATIGASATAMGAMLVYRAVGALPDTPAEVTS
jgi:hypothetical protein